MEKLTDMLDYYVRACRRNAHDRHLCERFFDQAYGATEMYSLLNPEEENMVADMWVTTYRPQFEAFVFGS